MVTSVLQHKQKVDDVELTVKPYSDEDIKAEVIVSDISPRKVILLSFIFIYEPKGQ